MTAQARRERERKKRQAASQKQREADWRAREGIFFSEGLPPPNVRSGLPVEWVEAAGGTETRAYRSRGR